RKPTLFLEEICLKLGISYNSSMMNYYQSQESLLTAEAGKMWENVTKPVIANNSGKFHSELTHADLQIFETVAGDMLEKLDYERVIPVSEKLNISEEHIKEFTSE